MGATKTIRLVGGAAHGKTFEVAVTQRDWLVPVKTCSPAAYVTSDTLPLPSASTFETEHYIGTGVVGLDRAERFTLKGEPNGYSVVPAV